MVDRDMEVVQEAWAAIGNKDMESLLARLDPEVEFVPFGAAMEGRSYRGHEGAIEWYEHEIDANWEVFTARIQEFRRVGERLLIFGSWLARGRTSGVELEVPATWIVQVRDGKIVFWSTHTDREEALHMVELE